MNENTEAEAPAETAAEDAAVDALNAPAPEPEKAPGLPPAPAPEPEKAPELPPAPAPEPEKAPELPPAPAAAEHESPLEVEAASVDSGEARDERKMAAQKAYAANPPEESRAARKARSSQE